MAKGRIGAIAFQGAGCAVCIASASMMTVAVKGLAAGEIEALMRRVRALVEGGEMSNPGDFAALSGVSRFPARVEVRAPRLAGARGGAGRCSLTGLDRVVEKRCQH